MKLRFKRQRPAGPSKVDLEVMSQIRRHKGFSVFWVNRARGGSIDRLEKAGLIKRTSKGQYPWCPYKVVETDEVIKA